MSEGTTVALVLGGVAVAGAGAYFLLYRQQAGAGTSIMGTPPGYPVTALARPTPPGAPPPAPSATSQLMSDINGLNQAGCTAAAQKVGAGSLAAMGCSEFLKYATPLGVAQLANTEVQKIPVVGPAIGKVEHAVTSIVDKPISAVKGTVTKILSFF